MAEKNCKKCFHYDVCYAVGRMPERAETCTKYAPDVEKVVRCKDCKKFIEYSDDYKFKVEGADGDCHIRLMHSTDNQFCAVKYDDFCSCRERK